jgi:hypothetical protein
MAHPYLQVRLRIVAVRWISLVALLLWSHSGLADHLPPGLEPRVVALLNGPELVQLQLQTGDIAISAERIVVSVTQTNGQTLGKLQLLQANRAAKATVRSRSFDLVWQGAESQPVTQWLQAVATRDTGVWWEQEPDQQAAGAVEAARTAPQTLWFAVGWLVLAVAVLTNLARNPWHWRPWLVLILAALPLVLAATWSTAATTPVPPWDAAAAGRPVDAAAALGAVLRWQLRMDVSTGTQVLAVIVAGLCGIATASMATWRGRLLPVKPAEFWWIATSLVGACTLLVCLIGPGVLAWLAGPLLAAACAPVQQPNAASLLPRWLGACLVAGCGTWGLGWATVCAALLLPPSLASARGGGSRLAAGRSS